jgi:hypothetical protein
VPPNLCGSSPQPFIGAVCTACGPVNNTCATGADCCTGTCTGSKCAACYQLGNGCNTNADCCSGFCDTTAFPAPTCS